MPKKPEEEEQENPQQEETGASDMAGEDETLPLDEMDSSGEEEDSGGLDDTRV